MGEWKDLHKELDEFAQAEEDELARLEALRLLMEGEDEEDE